MYEEHMGNPSIGSLCSDDGVIVCARTMPELLPDALSQCLSEFKSNVKLLHSIRSYPFLSSFKVLSV